MSRSVPPTSNPSSSIVRTSFLPPSHKLLQLAATRRATRPVHATDLRTTKFYKTKLCPFMQNKRGGGRCSEGFDCGYAHAVEELRNAPDLQRTKWCSKVVSGVHCTDPKCGYAHCAEELQPSTDRQTLKTSLCVFWARDPKLCLNGDKCRFAHGLDDLRQRPALAPRCPSPLISSALTCKKPSCSSLIPTQDGVTENTAATCSSDISHAMTMLPTTESGFDVSSESTPLVPWDESLYARCHSRMRTMLQSRILSDVRASILENEESVRKLLQGSAAGGRKAARTLQPSLPAGTHHCWEGRWNHLEGDIKNSLLTCLPSGNLEDIAGSENVTTHIVEEGSFSAATTAGPEGGEISYPSFPLLPSQMSRSDAAGANSGQCRYQGVETSPRTLALNFAKPSASSQLPSARELPLESISLVSKQVDEACHLISNGTSHSDRHFYGSAFVPSLQQLRTHSIDQASAAAKSSLPHIPVPSTLQCGSEEDKRNQTDQQPTSCPRFLQEGHAYRQSSLLKSPSSFIFSERPNADEQNARRLSQNSSHDSRNDLILAGGMCFTTYHDKLRPSLTATVGAEEKTGYNSRMEDNAAVTCVLDANSASIRRQQTDYCTPQHAEGYPAQSASPAAKSTKTFQHKRVFPCVEHSTILRRARRNGSDWAELHSSVLETATKPSATSRSPCSHDLSEHLHTEKKVTVMGSLAGPQAASTRPKKSSSALNAHAPPFFPRRLLPYTYCQEGNSAEAGIQGILSASLGVSTRRDTCGVLKANIVSASGRENDGTYKAARSPLPQLETHVEARQWHGQQPSTQNTAEMHCSRPSPMQGAVRQLKYMNANTAGQPTTFTCGGTTIWSKGRQKELPMRLRRGNPSYGTETPLGTLVGMKKDNFLCGLSPAPSVRRLSAYNIHGAETSDASAFYDAAAASGQESVVCSGEACENRLLCQNHDAVSGQHLMSYPGKPVGRTRSGGSEGLCIVASIPNLFRFRSCQKQQQHTLQTCPYARLGEP